VHVLLPLHPTSSATKAATSRVPRRGMHGTVAPKQRTNVSSVKKFCSSCDRGTECQNVLLVTTNFFANEVALLTLKCFPVTTAISTFLSCRKPRKRLHYRRNPKTDAPHVRSKINKRVRQDGLTRIQRLLTLGPAAVVNLTRRTGVHALKKTAQNERTVQQHVAPQTRRVALSRRKHLERIHSHNPVGPTRNNVQHDTRQSVVSEARRAVRRRRSQWSAKMKHVRQSAHELFVELAPRPQAGVQLRNRHQRTNHGLRQRHVVLVHQILRRAAISQ